MAIEDIGLADPRALRVALDACETYERLGSPEDIARAAVYLIQSDFVTGEVLSVDGGFKME